jgi:formate dehydrogenase iron-sulfur subunit
MTKVVVIDSRLCIGCKACEVACEREHGLSHIKVYDLVEFKLFVPFNCRHCAKAPCVTVCPVNACRYDAEGAVYIDPMTCIGCRLCATVCPFGVPEFDAARKVVTKCDLCIHRRKEGLQPACVTTCPTGALRFADISEITEERKLKTVYQAATSAEKSLELGNPPALM